MASLTWNKFARDARGVSDILAITFMFLIAIFAGVLVLQHAYKLDALDSAINRQLQMKTEYLYKAAELAQVENYSLSYFEAVAENLIGLGETVVPSDYLWEQIDNLLAYLTPSGYAVKIKLTYENENSWVQMYPSDVGEPGPATTQFTFSGKLTTIIAEAGENRIAQVDAVLTVFKP